MPRELLSPPARLYQPGAASWPLTGRPAESFIGGTCFLPYTRIRSLTHPLPLHSLPESPVPQHTHTACMHASCRTTSPEIFTARAVSAVSGGITCTLRPGNPCTTSPESLTARAVSAVSGGITRTVAHVRLTPPPPHAVARLDSAQLESTPQGASRARRTAAAPLEGWRTGPGQPTRAPSRLTTARPPPLRGTTRQTRCRGTSSQHRGPSAGGRRLSRVDSAWALTTLA